MKSAQIETVPSNAPATPSINGDVPMQSGIGLITISMLMIIFARLILGEPSAKP